MTSTSSHLPVSSSFAAKRGLVLFPWPHPQEMNHDWSKSITTSSSSLPCSEKWPSEPVLSPEARRGLLESLLGDFESCVAVCAPSSPLPTLTADSMQVSALSALTASCDLLVIGPQVKGETPWLFHGIFKLWLK